MSCVLCVVCCGLCVVCCVLYVVCCILYIVYCVLYIIMQGAGGFGSVYAARWRDKDVAVKRLSPSIRQDSEQYKALVREVELSSKFNSERLVRVYGACLKVRFPLC